MIDNFTYFHGFVYIPVVFDTIAFPMMRAVFARTVAADLVTVQPMNPPNPPLYFFISPWYKSDIIETFKYFR